MTVQVWLMITLALGFGYGLGINRVGKEMTVTIERLVDELRKARRDCLVASNSAEKMRNRLRASRIIECKRNHQTVT